MKLYHCTPSRSCRARWLIAELGIPCEIVEVNLFVGEQKKPEYLRIHPHGWVPALVDGDQTIIESSAIVLYLADKYPEKKLAPTPGSPARAPYYQWTVYGPANIDPQIATIVANTVFLPENLRNPEAVKTATERFKACAEVLTATLERQPYLLGSEFSAADVIIGYNCWQARFLRLLGDYPVLQMYFDRLAPRPAFQKAFTGLPPQFPQPKNVY